MAASYRQKRQASRQKGSAGRHVRSTGEALLGEVSFDSLGQAVVVTNRQVAASGPEPAAGGERPS